MKTSCRQLVAAMGVAALVSISSSVSAQNWLLAGNSSSSGDQFLAVDNNYDIIFKTNSTEKFRIYDNGDLGWASGKLFVINGTPFMSALGTANTCLGLDAGTLVSGNGGNSFFGYHSGYTNTTGFNNTFMGANAGLLNAEADQLTMLGAGAGANHELGDNCTFVGGQSGLKDSTGIGNTFIGMQSGFENYTGNYNTAVGHRSGDGNVTGTGNVMIGPFTGTGNSSGSNNICLGNEADMSDGISNATSIGYDATVTASNTMRFGTCSVIRWGFGVNAEATHAIEVGCDETNGNGAFLSDAGDWNCTSDRNKKTNITELKGRDILDKISTLSLTKWSYKGQEKVYHIGPMAQDFHRVFGLGESERYISVIDPAGVALVGVQELDRTQKAQASEIEALTTENADLRLQIAAIREQLLQLTGKPLDIPATGLSIPVLFQNEPNPASEQTVIRYNVPSFQVSAVIRIYHSDKPEVLLSFPVSDRGNGNVTISAFDLQPGSYTYELVVDGRQVDVKRMMIVK